MLSHYLDIVLRMPEIGHHLHARLLAVTHRRIAAGAQLAVAWPDWKGMPGEFGFLFRVFGAEPTLAEFAQDLAPMIDRGMIRLYPVAQTPQTQSRIVFARDHGVTRLGPAGTRRLAARAKAQGRTFIPKSDTPKSMHHLPMQSMSSSQPFHLFVRRISGNHPTEGGHNYGLGYALPDF